MVLLWSGVGFILLGIGALAIDRQAVHFIYDHVSLGLHNFLTRTTHLAKAAHWLTAAVLVTIAAWLWRAQGHHDAATLMALHSAVAFLLALAAGTIIIHTFKLFLGRRRPRDELEMKLYGFIPFGFDLKRNSFPSGHALTIFCVAVIATTLVPQAALVWFALAFWLAITRALLTAHFLSDVFVGAGVGILCAREVVVNWFPALALAWF